MLTFLEILSLIYITPIYNKVLNQEKYFTMLSSFIKPMIFFFHLSYLLKTVCHYSIKQMYIYLTRSPLEI